MTARRQHEAHTTSSRRAACLFAAFSLALLALPAQAAPGGSPSPIAPAVDHHLHIQGPDAAAELKRMAARLPDLFKGIDPGLLRVHTMNEALRALDEAGIRQGVLLSGGYLFASPYARADHPDVPRLTRRENRYTVEAARRSGGRLVAFIGVNPLDPGALAEIRYWSGRKGVAGVKMHLGNSDFDLRSPEDLAKAAAAFRAAREAGLAIAIHARPGKAYERADVERFIAEVISQAKGTPVQIAHAAGGGGLDEPTLQALGVYADAIERGAPGTEALVFDLAVVVVDDKTDPALAGRLAQLVRRIGPSRFVFGSDWPSLYSPAKGAELLQSQIPLTSEEWTQILSNRAPYLKPAVSSDRAERPR